MTGVGVNSFLIARADTWSHSVSGCAKCIAEMDCSCVSILGFLRIKAWFQDFEGSNNNKKTANFLEYKFDGSEFRFFFRN